MIINLHLNSISVFKIVVYCALILLSTELLSQSLCSGNLGDNIFTDGTFGRGTDEIVQLNPMIAPGYTYVTRVPQDGQYTLTKNTGLLGGLYSSWLRVGDQQDPDGYIMVVNASIAPDIFYEKVIEDICGNSVYEFSVDVINLIKAGTPNHNKPNVAFLIDGVVVGNSGQIADNEKWNKYGYTFTTKSSQTSVKLTLRNNAPGGSGNDLALDNISFRPCGPSSFIGAEFNGVIYKCLNSAPINIKADIKALNQVIRWESSNDSLTWTVVKTGFDSILVHNNLAFGRYFYRYASSGDIANINNAKCRVISSVANVDVLPNIYLKSDTICEGLTYQFGTQRLTKSGRFEEKFNSSRNCDSTVILDLVFIKYEKILTELSKTEPLCNSSKDGSISIRVNNTQRSPYTKELYSRNTQLALLNGINKQLSAGKYNITLSDRYRCTTSDSFMLIDPIAFEVSSIIDTTIELGKSVTFDISSNYQVKDFEWSPPIPNTNLLSPTFIPSQSTIYKLIAINNNECEARLTIDLKVNNDFEVFLSNALASDGSTINRYLSLSPPTEGIDKIVLFTVFDRYGSQVSKVSNPSFDRLWDGQTEGRRISPGVYIYVMDLLLINGVERKVVGSVTCF